MENLIFSLNATVPIFLLMILGIFLRKIGWVDHAFASKMNTFVFRLPLPVLVFSDLATVDFPESGKLRLYRVSLFRLPIEAAPPFLALHLSRIFMEPPAWRLL